VSDVDKILVGDCLEVLRTLPDESVHCCITSPPYWGLRDYGIEGQLGLEKAPEEYVTKLVNIFREMRRVLRKDGMFWLNMGDCYSAASTHGGNDKVGPLDSSATMKGAKGKSRRFADGLKPKDLVGIPWRVAFALQQDGWWWRGWLPWVKRAAMPESVRDRPNSALEIVHLFAKSKSYYFDMDAVRKELAPATIERDRHSRILDNDGPQAVRHDHETQADPKGRHWRNADLWFESIDTPHGMVFCDDEPVGLDVTPANFSQAHFATFPPKLVEPLIKASTSEKGCCPECGSLYRRLRKQGEVISTGGSARTTRPKMALSHSGPLSRLRSTGKNASQYANQFQEHAYLTVGWQPGCNCGGEPVPCIVLDPFMGAGTTGLVASGLRRSYIGIEDMARKRIHGPLFAEAKDG
jgi:DNA modification methylase